MKDLRTKDEVKEYARLLKNFYGELYTYILVNGGLVLVWLFSGAGYFWPIWPIGVWGISLIIKASKLQIIDTSFYEHCHAIRERVIFLKKDWEDQKVSELLKQARDNGVIKGASEEKQVRADIAADTDDMDATTPATTTAAGPKATGTTKTGAKKPNTKTPAKKAASKPAAKKPAASKKAPLKK